MGLILLVFSDTYFCTARRTDYLYISCLYQGMGLIPPEFTHLLSTLLPEAALPSISNTLPRPPGASSGSTSSGSSSSIGARRQLLGRLPGREHSFETASASVDDAAMRWEHLSASADTGGELRGPWFSGRGTGRGQHARRMQQDEKIGAKQGDGPKAHPLHLSHASYAALQVNVSLAEFRETTKRGLVGGALGSQRVLYLGYLPQLQGFETDTETRKARAVLDRCRGLHMY